MTFEEIIRDIKVAAGTIGGITLAPLFDPSRPAFEAGWLQKDGVSRVAQGDTEIEALSNLLLVLKGKGAEVLKAVRLRDALALEARAEAEFQKAVEARVAIENEAVVVGIAEVEGPVVRG